MPLVARISAGWQRRQDTGTKDARGNAVYEYLPAIPMKLFAIEPTGSSESSAASMANRTITTANLLAPRNWEVVSPADRVVVGAVVYEVDGDPQDLTQGPFNYKPGVVVAVKKVSA